MKLLFYRNTHDDNGAKTLSPEDEAIWDSQIHAGGFVAHQLDAKHGKRFYKLMDAILSYEDTFRDGKYHNTDEVLAALLELIRVGLIRYEIVP